VSYGMEYTASIVWVIPEWVLRWSVWAGPFISLFWHASNIVSKSFGIEDLIILKENLNTLQREVVSSFHIKHVIFWCVERCSCQWVESNYITCLKICLKMLIKIKEMRHCISLLLLSWCPTGTTSHPWLLISSSMLVEGQLFGLGLVNMSNKADTDDKR
jgi:hypothetical protein